MTILKSSKDPVILKKVSMKIWHLKDQFIAILKARLEKAGGDMEKIKDISDLQKEFIFDDQWLEPQNEDEDEKEIETEAEEGGPYILKRRVVEIPEDKMAHGQALLFEIDFDRIHFFSEKVFHIGSTILLKLDVPKSFGIAAIVVDCRAYDLESKIISKIKYPYRVVAEFKFFRTGQRTLLRNFLMAVDPRSDQEEVLEETIVEEEIPTEPSEDPPPEIDKEEEEKESA